MQYVGIDYSMSCPCMCILGPTTHFKDAKFFYLTSVKKNTGAFLGGNIVGVEHKEYYSEQERYDNIAEYFITNLPIKPLPKIAIEDYSMGSKGKVFNIAENTGLLKHKLWEVGYRFSLVPPTVLKKFASGKGNADKDFMYQQFLKEDGSVDIAPIFSQSKKIGSPISDIIDSYYLARYICYLETKPTATGKV